MYQLIYLFFISTLIIYFFNNFLLNNNLLIYNNKISQHKDEYKSKILLSGGLCSLAYLLIYQIIFNFSKEFLLIIFFSVPFLFLGFFSDINFVNKTRYRLSAMILFSTLSIFFLKLNIVHLDIIFLKKILENNFFSYFFAILCLVIVINGSNFIDGKHGNLTLFLLTSVTSIIFIIEKNIIQLTYSNDLLILIPFLIIFTFFNFYEKSFFGDSGSYFFGSIISLVAIDIFLKNNNLSAYYIANLLIYPAYEVFVSVTRRSLSKRSALHPDKYHLHNLIFYMFDNKHIKSRLINILTTLVIFTSNAFFIFFSSLNPENKNYQLNLLVAYIFIYSATYIILRFIIVRYKKNYNVR